MVSKTMINSLLVSAVAFSFAAPAFAHAEPATGSEKEKCYGVSKAGQNDCAAANGSHSCGAMAPSDGLGDEWVAVPKGLCAKLVNGSLTPVSTGAPANEQPPASEAPVEGDKPE